MPQSLAAEWLLDPKHLSEEDLWKHYEWSLQAFDWTYSASDNTEIWQRGQEQDNHIQFVRGRCEEFDLERATALYYKFSFWHNEDGTAKFEAY